MRILLASATLVALASPAAQAGQVPHKPDLFPKCHIAFWTMTQCAENLTRGNHNKARIDQNQTWFGFQLGLQYQKGDGNDAYTGQTGSNEVALTVQKGNNNTAYTSQDGYNKASVTIQNGSGMWGATSSGGNNTVTYVIESN